MRQRVVDANRVFYRDQSRDYTAGRERPEFLARYTRRFERDYSHMHLRPGAEVLDCCTGFGLLARLFLDKGCRVTAVDLSPEMLDRFVDERAETVCSEVGDYLVGCNRSFDLVAFGSAVHHIWDYDHVLSLALDRLRAGGILYLVGEPLRQRTGFGRAFRQAEIVRRKIRHQPRDVLPAIRRRLAYWRTRTGSASETTERAAVGFYAEIHSFGLDHDTLVRVVTAKADPLIFYGYSGGRVSSLVKRMLPGYGPDHLDMVATRRASN
jgi:SAM-dependent methyltransferase